MSRRLRQHSVNVNNIVELMLDDLPLRYCRLNKNQRCSNSIRRSLRSINRRTNKKETQETIVFIKYYLFEHSGHIFRVNRTSVMTTTASHTRATYESAFAFWMHDAQWMLQAKLSNRSVSVAYSKATRKSRMVGRNSLAASKSSWWSYNDASVGCLVQHARTP